MEILYTKEAETDYLDASLITVMQVSVIINYYIALKLHSL